MSMQQRNTVVSLVSFLLILGFLSFRVFQMVQTGTFIASNVFRMWGIVIVAAIAMTIAGMILTTIGASVVYVAKTNENPPEEDYLEDERDKLIALKGTRVSHTVYSIGVLIAMIIFVLNQVPLVLFTLLIVAGLVAQIVSDVYRLFRYRTGS